MQYPGVGRRQQKELVCDNRERIGGENRAELLLTPRSIAEAAGALEDARALQKIAEDQLLIARNHVRKIILEEYPPQRHEALRQRFLPADEGDSKPFTMDG